MSNKNNKTVSLVLGSGGARGMAHIGVIHELEKNGYEIAAISGCSMGALVGGVYAAGKLNEFEKWIRSITKVDMLTMLDISWGNDGLVKGDKIINTLKEVVGDLLIEDLPIPYTAVATDITNEREVWINSGSLFDAIRASISLPLFFTPVQLDGCYLIDGGVLNPVPIAPTFSDDTSLTIAVNLGGPEEKNVISKSSQASENNQSPFQQRISEYINKLSSVKSGGLESKLGAYDVANQAFDAMQSTIARMKLAAYPADINIDIARNACGTLEFHLADEMIALGRDKTKASLEL